MKKLKHIFIIGKSRSGKTLLGNIISVHKDTFWFSNISDKFTNINFIPVLHRIIDLPIVGRKIKKMIINQKGQKFYPRPSEGNRIYHTSCKFEYQKYSYANELNQKQGVRFKAIIEKHSKYTGKSNFLNDQSANVQRIEQIVNLFPDAKFIHVIRDGRAVANEIIRTDWWMNSVLWWCGKKPQNLEKEGKELAVLGAEDWEYAVRTILQKKYIFRDNYLEVRYENLANQTKKCIKEVIAFCELKGYKDFYDYIPNKIINYNYRYREELTWKQIHLINRKIGELLRTLNYN